MGESPSIPYSNIRIKDYIKMEIKEFDSGDYGDAKTIRICVGSQHRIVIDKLYGPACVKDLVIVWDGNDWNVRTKNTQLRNKLKEFA